MMNETRAVFGPGKTQKRPKTTGRAGNESNCASEKEGRVKMSQVDLGHPASVSHWWGKWEKVFPGNGRYGESLVCLYAATCSTKEQNSKKKKMFIAGVFCKKTGLSFPK
jgi:hypothetical protein